MNNDTMSTIKQVLETGKGKLQLCMPIMDGDEEISELNFDLRKLSGAEFCTAFDSTYGRMGSVSMPNNHQLLHLFAIAAAKQTDKIDAKDIVERICMEDAQVAVEMTLYFFKHSSLAASKRICSE